MVSVKISMGNPRQKKDTLRDKLLPDSRTKFAPKSRLTCGLRLKLSKGVELRGFPVCFWSSGLRFGCGGRGGGVFFWDLGRFFWAAQTCRGYKESK